MASMILTAPGKEDVEATVKEFQPNVLVSTTNSHYIVFFNFNVSVLCINVDAGREPRHSCHGQVSYPGHQDTRNPPGPASAKGTGSYC